MGSFHENLLKPFKKAPVFQQNPMDKKIKTYALSPGKKEIYLQRISRFLERDSSILFAYAHGSFLETTPFRDLDIAPILMHHTKEAFSRHAQS
jgi:hypothetical protein